MKIILNVVPLIIFFSGILFAEEKQIYTGLRAGIADENVSEDFKQFEVFKEFSLPWWNYEHSLGLILPSLDISLGVVAGNGDEAFLYTFGPDIQIKTDWDSKISLHIGGGITFISDRVIENRDFGGLLQFHSFLGFRILLPAGSRLGYRYQHMSNAHIYSSNPGLNLHLLEILFKF